MLKKISFKDYKAFDYGEIQIKPITILLGANSVGKSSLLQLILMLQQTALSEKNYKSALRLHGGFVSLGEGLNLIRKKEENRSLVLNFDINNDQPFNDLKSNILARFCNEMLHFGTFVNQVYEIDDKGKESIFDYIYKFGKKNKINVGLDYRFKLSPDELNKVLPKEKFKELIISTHNILNKNSYRELPKEVKESFFYFQPFRINHFVLLKESKDDYLQCYELLSEISKAINKKLIKIEYTIIVRDKLPLIKKVSINSDSKELISLEFSDDAGKNYRPIGVSSSLTELPKSQKFLDSLSQVFQNRCTIFSFVNNLKDDFKNPAYTSILIYYLGTIFKLLSDSLLDLFKDDNINYVSPLRAHPKRYYFLDKAKNNVYIDTLDGDAITEILKDKSDLKNQVNEWFKKFNLKIDVDHLQDIIHKLIVNQNEMNLDITDVGFGISQVLPVIIQGFLSHQNSITLIEQPEIHLHPQMQADLADLFIDIVCTKSDNSFKTNKFLIIETHSEYILKRLRRRISDGTIPSNLVGIYLIDPQTNEKGAVIKELEIESKGHFQWPIDFYGGELLKDTTEFLKNQ